MVTKRTAISMVLAMLVAGCGSQLSRTELRAADRIGGGGVGGDAAQTAAGADDDPAGAELGDRKSVV